MIKQPEEPIILQESDGERHVFDPVSLQDTLVRCFLGAGLRENCYLAEDISLAVEHAFEHSTRPGRTFARSELESAVVRILGDTGLGEVAALFKRTARSSLSVDCRTDAETIQSVLRKFMAGAESHLKFLAGKVTEAAEMLNIKAAPPGLLVELARYYESAEPGRAANPEISRPQDKYHIISSDDIRQYLSPETRALVQRQEIRIHSISRMFPCVRLFFFISAFASRHGLEPPVTEMTLAPMLFHLGEMLEECRLSTQKLYCEVSGRPDASLPVYLNIPDMEIFAEKYMQASGRKTGRLELEIARMIADAIPVHIEKLNF